MDFGFTEDQRMLRESVRRFMQKECTREYIRECNENERFPIELYENMAKQGWMGIPFPAEYGGAGLSPVDWAMWLTNRHMVVITRTMSGLVAESLTRP